MIFLMTPGPNFFREALLFFQDRPYSRPKYHYLSKVRRRRSALIVEQFWKKMKIGGIFNKRRRYCRLYPRWRTPLSYDNAVPITNLKILSQGNPIDVPEFLSWNINWLDVISEIWYHNFADEFLSWCKQKAVLLEKVWFLCCVYPIILWTELKSFLT